MQVKRMLCVQCGVQGGSVQLYKILKEKDNELWDNLSEIKPTDQFKIASKKEVFDFYIKKSLKHGSNYLPGIHLNDASEGNFCFYIKKYNRHYDRYLCKNLHIENNLSVEIREAYENGKGNEFSTGKFYSVASSSRFAVASFSENINGMIYPAKKMNIYGKVQNVNITFEKALQINDIHTNHYPQIDVMLETAEDVYFFEVKCHEIFDNHKEIKLKQKYKDSKFFKMLFSSPIDNTNDVFIKTNGNFLNSTDFLCILNTHHFDFKQFLCHLMGIFSYQESCKKKIHFYYLFYKNVEYENNEPALYSELESELKTIFVKFGDHFKNIDFGYLYNDKFELLKKIEKTT